MLKATLTQSTQGVSNCLTAQCRMRGHSVCVCVCACVCVCVCVCVSVCASVKKLKSELL